MAGYICKMGKGRKGGGRRKRAAGGGADRKKRRKRIRTYADAAKKDKGWTKAFAMNE